MQVRVIGFGVLQEVFGASECRVDIDQSAPRVTEVLDRLAQQFPTFSRHRPYTACAIGDRMIGADDPVAGDQPLVLLPPVSGG